MKSYKLPVFLIMLAIMSICMLYGWEQSPVRESDPVIRVEPDSLSFNLPRFTWTTQEFLVFNDGNQPLSVSITDTSTTGRIVAAAEKISFSPEPLVNIIQQRLKRNELQVDELIPNTPASMSGPETIVISDSSGDTPNPGLDVVSVDITETAISYNFRINYVGTPDTNSVAILAVDLDQNFGTGSFPAPLGFGPGVFDLGSEFDIIFDIGNLLGSLPLAYAIEGRDTSFTPAAISLPMTIGTDFVTAQFAKLFNPTLIDDNYYAGLTTIPVGTFDVPDFAPNYGHGLFGQESGLSWLTELDSAGNSSIPLTGTIAPGDSMVVQTKIVSVNPDGDYEAEININNNSSNNPNLIVPVNVNISGIPMPVIQVTPAQISDTLLENQSAQQYSLTVTNIGSGNLIYFVNDSLAAGQDWLTILSDLPVGQLGSGESATIDIQADPTGLVPNQSYTGYVVFSSNDVSSPELLVPVEIYVKEPTGIADRDINPEKFLLFQNYPNPFNPKTVVSYQLAVGSNVELSIYNLLGQKIRTLVKTEQPAGTYQVEWEGVNDAGQPAASGVYLYRLFAGDLVQTRKMILLR